MGSDQQRNDMSGNGVMDSAIHGSREGLGSGVGGRLDELVILSIAEKHSSIFSVLNSHCRCIVVHMICI